MTEVDTFDDRLGGWTEYDYVDVCARCAWRRDVHTKTTMETLAYYATRDDRLFYLGEDRMLEGSLIGEVRVRAEPPPALPAGWDAVPREDSARILVGLLHRVVAMPVPVTFETDAGAYELSLRPFDLSRNALAMSDELARNDTWFAVLGAKDDAPVKLEVTTHASVTTKHRVARLLLRNEEQWCANADHLFDALDEMWRGYRAHLHASLASRSILLAEMFDAVTAGIGLHRIPVETRGSGLDLLAHITPSVHAEVMRSHQGAEGSEIWRGVKAHSDRTTHPAQHAGWLRENRAHDDAYYLDVRPGDVTVASQRDGCVMAFADTYPPLDLVGLRARLDFAWRHRATFIDGLTMFDGVVGHDTAVRIPGDQPLRLVPIDRHHPALVIEPRPSITVGRSTDNDVPLPDTIASRRQCLLFARADGWYLRDAESTGGTYLNHELVKTDAALHLGDVLRFGGLTLLVC